MSFGRKWPEIQITNNRTEQNMNNNNIIKNNEANLSEKNDVENALKELLQQFSSITQPGGKNEHLLKCVQHWFSQHKEFTETQVFEHLERVAYRNYDYACLLGFFYEESFGTISDPQQAFIWYLRAAEHNDSLGQNQVGDKFLNGYGTEMSHEKAFYWYQKALDNNCSSAKHNLGICYRFGIHVKKNDRHALYWYSKSAEMGDELGKRALANAYLNGIGTNADTHKSLKLLFLQAKNLGRVHSIDKTLLKIFHHH
ncbi:10882_t:CDS:2 [Ambispora leptoticha]|uniref:10882_t:CDS:1 n=1 Tax=Ambispora leptoticha TaxID=144679 RepID=A0A9N9B6Q9_9GLOM|nr:10882_t:CDS:2 [Ambispora leptoticha]